MKSHTSKYFLYVVLSIDMVLAFIYLIFYGAFHLLFLWNNDYHSSWMGVVDGIALFTVFLIIGLVYFLVKGFRYLKSANRIACWQVLRLTISSGLTILIYMFFFISDFSLIEVLNEAKGILEKAWIILIMIGLRFLPIYFLVKVVKSISDFSQETLGVEG